VSGSSIRSKTSAPTCATGPRVSSLRFSMTRLPPNRWTPTSASSDRTPRIEMLAARDRRSGDDSLSAVALIKTIERLIGERGGNTDASSGTRQPGWRYCALGTSSLRWSMRPRSAATREFRNSGFCRSRSSKAGSRPGRPAPYRPGSTDPGTRADRPYAAGPTASNVPTDSSSVSTNGSAPSRRGPTLDRQWVRCSRRSSAMRPARARRSARRSRSLGTDPWTGGPHPTTPYQSARVVSPRWQNQPAY